VLRKFFRILVIVAAVFGAIVSAGIGFGIYKNRALAADGRAYVDAAVPAIAAHWSKDELWSRAAPELKQHLQPGDLDRLFNIFSRLGDLVQYEGATNQNASEFTSTGSGTVATANYVAKAKFQNGEATFQLLVVKRDGQWMIQGFRVDSPVLAPGTPHPERL